MNDDAELLREFVERHSEEAFSVLVDRYVDFVYSAALRESRGNTHRAEEACQLVFIDLARKAPSLVNRTTLGGWLHLSTGFAVARVIRDERRWRSREQEAHKMSELNAGTSARDVEWKQVRPIIDQVLRKMDKDDREAILMRFFEGQTFSQIGARLGIAEDTVRKRVERSLEKLQALLMRRGITSTAAALGSVLATEAVTAAPPGLASTATSAALAATGSVAGGILSLMSTTKLQVAIVTAIVLAGGAGLLLQQQSNNVLRGQVETFRQQEEQSRRARFAAEKRAEDSLAKAAASEAQLAVALSKLNDASNSSAAAKSNGTGNDQPKSPAPVVLSKAEWVTLMQEHPELMQAQDIEVKYNIERRYQALFKNLNLTSDQITQFETLLIDKGHAILDVYAAAAAQGIDPDNNKQEYNRLVKAAETEIDGKIKSLLGDSGYAQMRTFDQTVAQRSTVTELQTNLANSSTPLTSDQVESLVKVLADTAPNLGRTGAIPSEAVVQAQAVLAPEQIRALQLMQQKGQTTQKFTETLQKLYGNNARGIIVR